MKNTSFKFASETIHPGESLSLALPLPQIFSCAPLYMPIKLIHGKQSGPTLVVIAAMYGNEINGTEIIHRLLSMPGLAKLRGTLIAIPVMNVHGLINRSRYLPQGIDLNRHFPGHKHGTNAERFANIFSHEIFNRADYCVNLQTGLQNFYTFPMVQFYEENDQTMDLARTFNAPLMVKSEMEPGSLQTMALEQNKVFIDFIAGEAMRFDPYSIKIGMNGILNIMRKLHMLPEQSKVEKRAQTAFAEKLKWISASVSGTHHTKKKVGQTIHEGELISVIKDPFGSNDNFNLESPLSGLIVGENKTPLIHEGDSLFQIAVLPAMESAAETFIVNQEVPNDPNEVPLK